MSACNSCAAWNRSHEERPVSLVRQSAGMTYAAKMLSSCCCRRWGVRAQGVSARATLTGVRARGGAGVARGGGVLRVLTEGLPPPAPHGTYGGEEPLPLQGAQPMPSHCPRDAKCQL